MKWAVLPYRPVKKKKVQLSVRCHDMIGHYMIFRVPKDMRCLPFRTFHRRFPWLAFHGGYDVRCGLSSRRKKGQSRRQSVSWKTLREATRIDGQMGRWADGAGGRTRDEVLSMARNGRLVCSMWTEVEKARRQLISNSEGYTRADDDKRCQR